MKESKTTRRPSLHLPTLLPLKPPSGPQPRKANGACQWNAAPLPSIDPGLLAALNLPPPTADTKGKELIYGSFQCEKQSGKREYFLGEKLKVLRWEFLIPVCDSPPKFRLDSSDINLSRRRGRKRSWTLCFELQKRGGIKNEAGDPASHATRAESN